MTATVDHIRSPTTNHRIMENLKDSLYPVLESETEPTAEAEPETNSNNDNEPKTTKVDAAKIDKTPEAQPEAEEAKTDPSKSEPESWKKDIYRKLSYIFYGKNVETFLRVLFFLDHEPETVASVSWQTLKSTVADPATLPVFTRYAVCLSEETKNPSSNLTFECTLACVYNELMDAADEESPEDPCEGFDLVQITDFDASRCTDFPELARAWKVIPLSAQSEILHCVHRITSRVTSMRRDIWPTDGVVARMEDIVQPDNALVATLLSFDSMVHIRRWWKGEISVRRCGKSMVDSTVSTAAGVAGAVTGAAVGAAACVVIGVVSGAVGGAVLGAKISHFFVSGLCEKMTEKLFGLPEEALENAYKFLGVEMTATNEEINEAYKKLCLKHHPDKGGDGEQFILLQVHMGVIKAAREDFVVKDAQTQNQNQQ